MKVGFTGTRDGMTHAQANKLEKLLKQLKTTEFHHGDCQGADEQAHEIVRALPKRVKIVGHPPRYNLLRAYRKCDEEREAKEYLMRNRDIVNEVDVLIATPSTNEEQVRSGTWSTVRYAYRLRNHSGVYAIVIKTNGEDYIYGGKAEL